MRTQSEAERFAIGIVLSLILLPFVVVGGMTLCITCAHLYPFLMLFLLWMSLQGYDVEWQPAITGLLLSVGILVFYYHALAPPPPKPAPILPRRSPRSRSRTKI
jgi:hypothetical protein